MTISVRQATISDIDALAVLFDSYRQFYEQPSDVNLARCFLMERFKFNQSIIFLAFDEYSDAIGFTQLFLSYSSVSAKPIYILNDLYTKPGIRKQGAGTALLEVATQFGRAAGAARLVLETAVSNVHAQSLYEATGWVRDNDFFVYNKLL